MSASFTQATGWRLFSVFSSVLTNAIALKLCGEHLGQGVFALVAACLQMIGFLPQLDGGFRVAVNRALLARPPPEARDRLLNFGQAFGWWFALAAFAVLAGMLGLFSLTPNTRTLGLSPLFFDAFAAAGAGSLLVNSQASLLTGLGHQWRLFLYHTLIAWTNLAMVAFGLRRGWSAWAFPAALMFSATVAWPVVWLWIRPLAPNIRFFDPRLTPQIRATAAELRVHSLAALRFQVVTAALYSVDVVLVALLCPSGRLADAYAYLARIYTTVKVILQSPDEAIWPRITQDRKAGVPLSLGLCRLNAWLHGGVTATLAVVAGPFVALYVHPDLVVPAALAILFSLRGAITGLASQPAYFLYGDGKFSQLSRYMGGELLLGLILGIPAAIWWGPVGVAAAFVMATLAGTLWLLPASYARATNRKAPGFLAGLWWRALLATCAASVVTKALLAGATSWPGVLAAGLGGVLAVLVLVAGWMARSGRPYAVWREWISKT